MNFKNCPFQVGHRYKAKQNMTFLNHILRSGEVLVFVGHAYDPHGGVTRFTFKNPETGEMNAWHVFDDDAIRENEWILFFEAVNNK